MLPWNIPAREKATPTRGNRRPQAPTTAQTSAISLLESVIILFVILNSDVNMSSCFGLTGLALDWISSYMHNWRQSVKIGDACPWCTSDSMISTFSFIWLSLILCVPKCMLLLLLNSYANKDVTVRRTFLKLLLLFFIYLFPPNKLNICCWHQQQWSVLFNFDPSRFAGIRFTLAGVWLVAAFCWHWR